MPLVRSAFDRPLRGVAALVTAAALAACSSPVKLDEAAPVESRNADGSAAGTAGTGAAAAGGTPQSQVATVDLARQRAAEEAAALLSSLPKTMYFDYDSFVLRDEYKPAIDGYAKLLNAARDRRLTLEGHADERGGREYNLALGQKRAEAVARALELLGVSASQVEAVSFGEERPADPGHDEAAWAKNRRVDIKGR
jgi:peptidoglycan-associated lipoprotein